MRFINFAIVKFTLFLILGIVLAHLAPNLPFFKLLLLLFPALFIFWQIARRQLFQSVYFGLTAYLCFFFLGAVNYKLRLPEYRPGHYVHKIKEGDPQLIQLTIMENLNPDAFRLKYIAQIDRVDNLKVSGTILLTIQKDSALPGIMTDDVLLVYGAISEIRKPLNPHQFDYSRYLENLDIYHQLSLSANELIGRKRGDASLRGKARSIRNYLTHKLRSTSIGTDEQAILSALILGERQEIRKDIYASYAKAGAIHVLAVSGLHVGIIYFILQLLLKPLTYVRNGQRWRYLLILLLLWGYAILTGLSPSVTRAVTMFSFFAVAQLLNRPTNAINTLFLSMFFLLLLHPKWLFHIGFQLSYLAVFFILWMQPKLYSLYHPKDYVAKLLWGLISVSVSAQLGVGPLSIYYFNQFPGLFLISNLVILPFLGLTVGLGILVFLLAGINSLPQWLAISIHNLITSQVQFIQWIASKEAFLFKDIHFSGYWLAACYLLIIGLLLLFQKYSYKRLFSMVASISICLGLIFMNKVQTMDSKLIIFHKSRNTLVAIKEGSELQLFSTDSSSVRVDVEPISSYRIGANCKVVKQQPLRNMMRFGSSTLLIIDSTAIYPPIDRVDYILLSGSPKLHLDRVIDVLDPKMIVADGSNYRSYVKRWSESCDIKKLPFHYTGEGGAFIIE